MLAEVILVGRLIQCPFFSTSQIFQEYFLKSLLCHPGHDFAASKYKAFLMEHRLPVDFVEAFFATK
jgi:hypothetical protein